MPLQNFLAHLLNQLLAGPVTALMNWIGHPPINLVRLVFGFALICTLLAETKLSNKGIGFLIIQAYSTFDMPRMYAMLIVLFVLAIGANALIGRLGGLHRIRRN